MLAESKYALKHAWTFESSLGKHDYVVFLLYFLPQYLVELLGSLNKLFKIFINAYNFYKLESDVEPLQLKLS